jgi:hypothetical protein
MIAETFANKLAPEGHAHVVLEALVNLLKFCAFFSKLRLDVTRPENVLQINPVLLDHEPVVDDQSSIVNGLLDLLRLVALSFEVPVAQNR